MRNPDGRAPYRVKITIETEGPSLSKISMLATHQEPRQLIIDRALYSLQKKLLELFEDIDYLDSIKPVTISKKK